MGDGTPCRNTALRRQRGPALCDERRGRSAAAWILPLSPLVLACAVHPEIPRLEEQLELPEHWAAVSGEAGERGGAAGEIDWLEGAAEPALRELVAEALNHNPGLRAAAARHAQARAEAQIAGAPLLPRAEVRASGDRNRGPAAGELGGGRSSQWRLDWRAEVSWEVDLWGRLRAARGAARSDAEAAARDLHFARLSVATRTAQAWFSAAAAAAQERLAVRNVESLQRSRELVARRYRGGLSSILDLRLAETDLASARANLQSRRDAVERASRALEVLVGRYPADRIPPPAVLPSPGELPAAGVPTALLAERPDLLAAAARLRGAALRTEEARAALWPNVTLRGSVSGAGSTLAAAGSPQLLLWSVVGSIVQPIFEGGRLRARVRRNRGLRDERFADYVEVALRAVREVEDALGSDYHLAEQERALRHATEHGQAAEQLARRQYRRGLISVLDLLETERRLIDAESRWLEVRRQRVDNRALLHLALGGAAIPTGGGGPP